MILALEPAEWTREAACADLKVNMFPSVRDPEAQKAAKAVCRDCPVARECLEAGLEDDKLGRAEERWGVWGHMNGPQRGRLAARRARAAAAATAHIPRQRRPRAKSAPLPDTEADLEADTQ